MLKACSVLIVGAGGLGCPAAIYLAAAGIGTFFWCNARFGVTGYNITYVLYHFVFKLYYAKDTLR